MATQCPTDLDNTELTEASPTPPPSMIRPCPSCQAEVSINAGTCKHCGEFLLLTRAPAEPDFEQYRDLEPMSSAHTAFAILLPWLAAPLAFIYIWRGYLRIGTSMLTISACLLALIHGLLALLGAR